MFVEVRMQLRKSCRRTTNEAFQAFKGLCDINMI